MKKTLERLANGIEKAGKNIGRFVKKHAKEELVALALASPFVMVNKAEGSQGEIVLVYCIDSPYTNSNWAFGHFPNTEEGKDKYDGSYYPMFNPSGVASEIISMVEGKELDIDLRPVNSTSSVSFNYTVISQGGGDTYYKESFSSGKH